MSKVALYARVSTDQQAAGLESQVRILKDYCSKNDILSYELFTDEETGQRLIILPAVILTSIEMLQYYLMI